MFVLTFDIWHINLSIVTRWVAITRYYVFSRPFRNTYLDPQLQWRGVLSAFNRSVQSTYIGGVPRSQQRVEASSQRSNHQSVHDAFQDRVQVQELGWLKLRKKGRN